MSIVTSIEKRGAVYNIYADGRLMARISRAAFERMPLLEGDAFDDAAYLASIAQSQMRDAYEAALRALDRSARSENALRQWLFVRGFLQPAVDAAIERLVRARLIDDSAYARRLVEVGASAGQSKNALKRKLRAKGIAEEDIERALEAVRDEDQLAAAKRQAEKMLPRYAKIERRAARAKLSQALARRGFPWSLIEQALSGLFDDD
jgi:regulatory protein